METEHRLQKRLTRQWLEEGIRLPSRESLLLVAWEVMAPSWKVNDALHGWGAPALDFLAVDQAGRLTAIELKRRLTAPLLIWRALCQVTHIAIALQQSATPKSVDSVRAACLSGSHGRVREHTNMKTVEVDLSAPWRRIVAAPSIDAEKVTAVAEPLEPDPVRAAQAWLDGRARTTATDLPVRRLAAMPPVTAGSLFGGVVPLDVNVR